VRGEVGACMRAAETGGQDVSQARAVVLLSGGLDSATCLAVAQRDGYSAYCVSIDYGQRHRHELDAASQLAACMGAAGHIVIPLDLRTIGGSALTADVAVPKDQLDVGVGVPVTYVPARNLVFLSLAVGYAEVLGARDVYTGVNAVDYSGYPDCRPVFIESFVRTANLATDAGTRGGERAGEAHFRVRTPLISMRKSEIIRLGASLGVPYEFSHSCYDPLAGADAGYGGVVVRACGHCDSCLIRARGFAEAGVPDPTRYA
jgi:7-cyano-7-deazaguanine synthase